MIRGYRPWPENVALCAPTDVAGLSIEDSTGKQELRSQTHNGWNYAIGRRGH
jgi:hypothetical protein